MNRFLDVTGLSGAIGGACIRDIRALLVATGAGQLVDLESGSGRHWASAHRRLNADGIATSIVLTATMPDLGAFARAELSSGGSIRGDMRRISPSDVPRDLNGVRTMFIIDLRTRRDRVRAALQDAVRSDSPIGVFAIGLRFLSRDAELREALSGVDTPTGWSWHVSTRAHGVLGIATLMGIPA